MKRSDYDKQLLKWVRDHYWDSLEKDKDLILRHLRTFAGDEHASRAINPPGQARPCDVHELYYKKTLLCRKCGKVVTPAGD